MNDNMGLEMMELNQTKESFWKKHKFGVGIVSGIIAVVLILTIVFAVGYIYIVTKGVTLVIGGNNGLLNKESVNKLNTLQYYMDSY